MEPSYKLYISTDEKNFIPIDDFFKGISKSIINFKNLDGDEIAGGFTLNEFLKVIDANKYGELLKEKMRLKSDDKVEETGGRRKKSRSKERRTTDKKKDDDRRRNDDDDDEDDVNSYGGNKEFWQTNKYTKLFL